MKWTRWRIWKNGSRERWSWLAAPRQNAEFSEQFRVAIANRDSAQAELTELRSERKNVRTRIEKLLGQMELLSAT